MIKQIFIEIIYGILINSMFEDKPAGIWGLKMTKFTWWIWLQCCTAAYPGSFLFLTYPVCN